MAAKHQRPSGGPVEAGAPEGAGEGAAEGAAVVEALPAGLYLVATPIGNLGDITLRALEVLRRADRIACEDTRTTRKLLNAHGITTKTTAYHDHSGPGARAALLDAIRAGRAVALVSDAGTPLVSDPGYKLVRDAIAEDLPVTSLPGPAAPVAALQLSGLPSDRFFFGGFLPAKSGARRRILQDLRGLEASLIFFESAARLAASLADMAEVLGERPAAIARELTKLHEELRRGPLPVLAAHYAEAGPPRGEIVVVIGPPEDAAGAEAFDLDAALRDALQRTSLRDAAASVAAASGLPKRRVYARALELAKESGGPGQDG
ncbi:16S rRNA (cytidine(1402)-2'-O)-methyltransferase [Pelagibius sp.]|uniref:16S rRNA (cytidine(1402)-2'-O)-methyltransferase n=1 Tax=Pelagibius sp. TaxID=1931238 RepID=UPI002603E2B9|nr:16S rRNA (cytidine(1402)-2'-O)-methyltransferase [Pelagibius sp.]